MVDFRRWILALAVLALFAGLASAQVGGTGNAQFQCAANVSSVPVLRAEGLTEQTGDIVITCTGGNPTPVGTVIPTVNISVNFNVPVTSRLVPGSASGTGVSEALLLIDEPGSASSAIVAGFGPQAPQRVCGASGTFFGAVAGGPTTGCTEFASSVLSLATPPVAVIVATDTVGGTAAGANVFQGIVNPNGAIPSQVTFFGVPVLAPVTTGTSRVFRITNIRINASAAAPGQVIASISVSNPTALPITSNVPAVGFIQPGLIVGAPSGSISGIQCTGSTAKNGTVLLSFSEGFATAFKTRVFAQTNTAGAGQGIGTGQNVPGTIFPSESNFVLPIATSATTTFTAGLADFGTRLKAVFHNVPAGLTIFVSTTNVLNNLTAAPAPSPIGGSAGNIVTPGFAQLVSITGNEITADPFTPVAGAANANTGNVQVVALTADVTGTATAVWEVVNTSPSSLETLQFAVFSSFAAGTVLPQNAVTVNQSFAPTASTLTGFTLTAGGLASGSAPIPRFADLSKTPGPTLISVNACHTVLLFPFVTNQAGFDTGIAIANTSQDPFGTAPQSGTCALNWFGVAAPAVASATPIIGAASTVPANVSSFAFLTSVFAPGFQGYMIATCNFQFAHGFAFISDIGAQKLAEGYLALVIPDTTVTGGAGTRSANPLSLAPAGSGESIAH